MAEGISKRWFAWAMCHVAGRYDALLADRKRDLLGDLEGTVLEIGPGTGTNFRYYLRPRRLRWIGVEPNPYMHPYLRRAGTAAGIEIDVRQHSAESMEVADGSIDAVVTTAVLCSVHDQTRALREIKRVLKPGGQLVFLEHVAASRNTGLRTVQQLVRPFWRCIVDGCDPMRDTEKSILETGFKLTRLETFELPLGPIAPHIAGIAAL
jgi:SAM-dependent methyltransferase